VGTALPQQRRRDLPALVRASGARRAPRRADRESPTAAPGVVLGVPGAALSGLRAARGKRAVAAPASTAGIAAATALNLAGAAATRRPARRAAAVPARQATCRSCGETRCRRRRWSAGPLAAPWAQALVPRRAAARPWVMAARAWR